jgi:hypothetical protein
MQMDFIYMYEIEQRNLLQLHKWGREGNEGERGWGNLTNYNINLIGIVTMNPPLYIEYILIKIF